MVCSFLCLILVSLLEKAGLPEATGEACRLVCSTSHIPADWCLLMSGDHCLRPVLFAVERGILDHEEGGLDAMAPQWVSFVVVPHCFAEEWLAEEQRSCTPLPMTSKPAHTVFEKRFA